MLEPDQWEGVLSRARGAVYRGTEQISSNAVLNLLEVGHDPVIRQKVAKRLRAPMRRLGWTGPRAMRIPKRACTYIKRICAAFEHLKCGCNILGSTNFKLGGLKAESAGRQLNLAYLD